MKYFFEPKTLSLSGKLIQKIVFEETEYERGENSKQIPIWLLILPREISVIQNSADNTELNTTSHGVKEIQLVLFQSIICIQDYENMEVLVRGKLFHGHTGHHHTEVLMNLIEITVK